VIPAATAETDTTSAPTTPADDVGAAVATGPNDMPGGGVRAVPDAVRRRLATLDRWWDPYSWAVTGVIVLIAGILRIAGLDKPKGYIFDEVYYPTDAWDMLTHGVEWDEKGNGPAYVVHPPLGKWMIAVGEYFFGNNEFGWRIAAAVSGTLMVLILIRLAYRLFQSVVLAGTAGLLLTLDGFQLVLSRTALLDIFLGLFVLASFAAMILDRDTQRRRWRRALEDGFDPGTGKRLPFRFRSSVPWWRLAAAVLLGCAIGVKWSAAFFVPFFLVQVVWWQINARRSAGVRRFVLSGLLADFGWLVLSGVLMTATYLGTWLGWFLTDDGYFRHWLRDSGKPEPKVLGTLINLWHYHQEAFGFHNTLAAKHIYQSWPWQWLLLGRPVAFYWSGDGPCGAPTCAGEILLLGTPLLWWSFLPALGALVWFGIARRDWRAPAIGIPIAAGLLPWFYYAISEGRTMFSFYLLPAVPFLILAVVYVLGAIMTPPEGIAVGDARSDRQLVGTIAVGVFVLLVAACFAFFYPIFVGQVIPYESWNNRMWLGPRWI
jgi:dolichyl-phosphate-mannose-protein mannosyltransferase